MYRVTSSCLECKFEISFQYQLLKFKATALCNFVVLDELLFIFIIYSTVTHLLFSACMQIWMSDKLMDRFKSLLHYMMMMLYVDRYRPKRSSPSNNVYFYINQTIYSCVSFEKLTYFNIEYILWIAKIKVSPPSDRYILYLYKDQTCLSKLF